MKRAFLDFVLVVFLLVIGLFIGNVVVPEVLGWTDKPEHGLLVGYGCEGASGPLYAQHEDHFPKCKEIR